MTREQAIDQAVLAVDVRGYWRKWLIGFVLIQHEPGEPCGNCTLHFGMVRTQFKKIAEQIQ